MSADAELMRCCLTLAAKAAGRTAPNPLVGAVVVKDGKIVGEGFHPGAGNPHAEVFALRAAGATAQGATLYVNLEPCNHTGRTPPCSEAVIAAGIRKVVIGMRDPNPTASGGIERLRAAGLAVTVGFEQAACEQLNEAFIHRVRHRRPFGVLKYAMTLDGKIAATSGHSAWVTGPQARQQVHALRGRCDAVIVGGNTVRRDNPNLTTHGVHDHNPLRVVMSRRLDLPEQANLWRTAVAPTLICTDATAQAQNPERVETLRAQGVEVLTLPTLTPAAVMQVLYDRGLLSVLWECGGTLAAQAVAEGMVQKVWAFIAPKLIGGAGAPSPLGELGLTRMDRAIAIANPTLESVGSDWLIQGYLDPGLAVPTEVVTP
ncbi:MAG: bifunctional diaminohydroxyphosphoribosylaminopyrimidine deaminase/5-amino-6-(5-phosphoribosylamino)uracil reductase RibD [Cyanobacteria bacterium J06628_6]